MFDIANDTADSHPLGLVYRCKHLISNKNESKSISSIGWLLSKWLAVFVKYSEQFALFFWKKNDCKIELFGNVYDIFYNIDTYVLYPLIFLHPFVAQSFLSIKLYLSFCIFKLKQFQHVTRHRQFHNVFRLYFSW